MSTKTSTVAKTITKPQISRVEFGAGKNIGLMGGTFNPVHQAHLIMAEQVYSKLNLDEVWFVPDYIPPHANGKETIDAKHRVEMLKIATKDNPHFKVEMIEILRGGVSYTIDTLQALKKRYPQHNFYLIIGGDMVSDLKNWRTPELISQVAKIVGVKRPGYIQRSDFPIIWVDAPYISISSTEVRKTVHLGGSVKYIVPDAVIDYIKQEGLYLE